MTQAQATATSDKPAAIILNIDRYKERVFFSLSIGRWGNRAKISDAGALREFLRLQGIEKERAKRQKEAKKNGATFQEVMDNGAEATPGGSGSGAGSVDTVTATKRLLSPKCAALKAISDHLNEVKDQLTGPNRGIAQQSNFMRGVYTLKKEKVETAFAIVKEGNRKLREELLPAFIEAWPGMVEAAKSAPLLEGGLGPLFDSSDYPEPEQAASKYYVRDQYLQIGISDQLSEELKREQGKAFESKIQNALEQSMQALRAGFASLVDHAVEKLTVAPGERPKQFKNSIVGNFVDFIRTFDAKDFGDEALGELVKKAEAIIAPDGKPLDPERLRKFANVREGVKAGFAEIQGKLDGLIVERKGRKIDLSEED